MSQRSTFSTQELEKVIESLKKAIELHQKTSDTELKLALLDSCIQRFEYCIELCWKTSVKIMGSTTMAAKPAIREMARNNLIQNPDIWMIFIDSRNETSHAYDEDIAAKVFVQIQLFLPEAFQLLHELEKANT